MHCAIHWEHRIYERTPSRWGWVVVELHCRMEEKYRKRWFRRGAIGCTLIGAGLSIALDALAHRLNDADWWVWAGEGTAGLVVFMTGLAFFGDAVRYRVHMDREGSAS